MIRREQHRPAPKPSSPADDAELMRIKASAENRMLVFDAAPPSVRAAANEAATADRPLHAWWNSLQEHQQEAILDGQPCPPRREELLRMEDIFGKLWK